MTRATGIHPSLGYFNGFNVLPKCTPQPWSEDKEIAGYHSFSVSISVKATPNGKPFW